MPKINKREIITRLLIIPKTQKRPFWAREMKMLNTLMEKFPEVGFWQKFNFKKQYDSLAFFISPYGQEYLKKKYNEYNYKIPKKPKVKLGKKVGDDKIIAKKNKTIRDFFNE